MTTFLQLHSAEVSSSFGREAFSLRHELVAHPLLGLEPLAELADSSAPDEVERNSATVDAVVPGGGSVAQIGLSPGEIVRTIEVNDCSAFTPHVVHVSGGQTSAAGRTSLSLAIAMKTEATMRESAVDRANGHVRRIGMKPCRPGLRPRSDRVKHTLVRAVRPARSLHSA